MHPTSFSIFASFLLDVSMGMCLSEGGMSQSVQKMRL